MPERIGNGEKTKAWAEEIIRNSQVRYSNRSRVNLSERNGFSEPRAPASSPDTGTEPPPIQYREAEENFEDVSRSSPVPDVQTVRDETQRENNPSQPDRRPKIDAEEVAGRVYRLMQKDLLLQIERAGK
jgi:hypothetical protein